MRKKVKGRASKGMLIGINKDWVCEEWKEIGIETEEIMRIRRKKKEKNIKNVYNAEGKKDIGDVITKKIAVYENKEIIIGGDFNIRIGELGGEDEKWDIRRKSKDKNIRNEGRKFMKTMQNNRLYVLNRKTKGN